MGFAIEDTASLRRSRIWSRESGDASFRAGSANFWNWAGFLESLSRCVDLKRRG